MLLTACFGFNVLAGKKKKKSEEELSGAAQSAFFDRDMSFCGKFPFCFVTAG
jgi:hypothetical protein